MTSRTSCAVGRRGWPLERALFALAGTATLVTALLAAAVSPGFLLLTAFVGLNQWMFVAFGACPASLLLSRLLGLTSLSRSSELHGGTSR